MDSGIRKETVSFLSSQGKTNIRGVIWWPSSEPVGVVQVVHGMAEHIMRYDSFARYLCARGFVVCGHDHLGHGESVNDESEWGHLPIRNGRDILVGDVGLMRGTVRERVDASLPHFLFGHSMGSFVVRAYIAECGQGLAGAIVCGTGHIAPATSAAGNKLAHAIARMRGETYVSKTLENLSIGAYAKAIKDAHTPLDWLSHNRQNVKDYISDKMCGFSFTAGGNAALTALTQEVCSRACCARVPKDLPLLYIAGDGDPVGAMGKGVRIAAKMARDAGSTDVTCKIYENMRHEILNEDGAEHVMEDIATWMEERI